MVAAAPLGQVLGNDDLVRPLNQASAYQGIVDTSKEVEKNLKVFQSFYSH
jgi:hypothetical protein